MSTLLSSDSSYATIGNSGFIIYHDNDVAIPITDPSKPERQYNMYYCDCHDGQIQAFHRSVVPILLPYIESLDKLSWWSSQGFLYEIARTCVPRYSILLPNYGSYTGASDHSEYPRGRYYDKEEVILKSFFSSYGLSSHEEFKYSFQQSGHGDCAHHYIGYKPINVNQNIISSFSLRNDINCPDCSWMNSSIYNLCFNSLSTRFKIFIDKGILNDPQV